MPSDWTYRLLVLFGEGGITNITFVIIVLFFIYGFVDRKFARVAPGLMTSLGILGTFCGIYVALYPLDFTPGNMNNSVTQLLDGMRTAFFTSLLGISSSIAFRAAEAVVSRYRGNRAEDQKRVENDMTPEQKLIIARLEDIRNSIAGEEDSSLITQVKNLRTDNRDGFKKLDNLANTIEEALVANLRNLIDEIRTVVGKQLGESLEKLIANIEKALIEQFGKTFIEFNQATQAIKQWQQEHRSHVIELTNAFNLAAEQIESIARNCQQIPPTLDKLREAVGLAHTNVESLSQLLTSFAQLQKQAEDSFPTIKEHLDRIGEDLAKSAEGFSGLEETLRRTFESAEAQTQRIAKQHAEEVNRVAESMRMVVERACLESSQKITTVVQGLESNIEGAFNAAEQQTRHTVHQHSENVAKMAESMRQSIEGACSQASSQVAQIVQQSIATFEKAMTEEANRVARGYGENMKAIAERCAQAIEAIDERKGGNHGW